MRPAIIGIQGLALTPREAELLRCYAPVGVILFRRNIEAPAQLAALVAAIRAILPTALLMVDQEGGRVARLRPPHWRAHPPAAAHPSARATWLTGALIGLDCRAAGLDLVAAPVLDVRAADGHDVIGDRAFSADPRIVAEHGCAMAQGLLATGVQPVGKHAPGHGRAPADSHAALPDLDDVADNDLQPFFANRWLPWFMTAHIRYRARDMQNPATQSRAVIHGVIRNPAALGFDGVLVSDDLAMGALHGSPGDRAAAAIAAGCDIALHCSGVAEECEAVLAALAEPEGACLKRLAMARKLAAWLQKPSMNAAALAAERAALMPAWQNSTDGGQSGVGQEDAGHSDKGQRAVATVFS